MNKKEYISPANSIIEEMQSVLPIGWNKVCFCFEMAEGAFSGDYFVFIKNNSIPIRANALCKDYNLTDAQIQSFYEKVYNILKPLWTKTKSLGGSFSHYILSYTEKTFEEEYDYKELTDTYGFFDFWLEWKKEYVKP